MFPIISISDLSQVQLFIGLTTKELNRVIQETVTRELVTDEFLFHEEDTASHIYYLIRGRIKLSQLTLEGKQIILRYIAPGDTFGVVAVISNIPYPVSAQAITQCQLLSWDTESMNRLIELSPIIASNALKILANQVNHFQKRIKELSTERVERRIARTLLRLARQTGKPISEGILIDLPLSRQDLAEMTGTTLYTVSRTLSQWESLGLIKSTREQVVICYPHGLVSIAEDLPPSSTINSNKT